MFTSQFETVFEELLITVSGIADFESESADLNRTGTLPIRFWGRIGLKVGRFTPIPADLNRNRNRGESGGMDFF